MSAYACIVFITCVCHAAKSSSIVHVYVCMYVCMYVRMYGGDGGGLVYVRC